MEGPDLSVIIGDIQMKNPVMAASGTFGFGREFARMFDIGALGAIVTKGITMEPREGNPPPRLWETPSGLLNSVGLENPGICAFLREELPYLARAGAPVVVNIAGDTVQDFCDLASRLDASGQAAAVEVNISCPNVHAGGRAFASDPEAVYRTVSRVRRTTGKTLIAKLSPNVPDIAATAKAAEAGGADAVSCANTHLGAAFDTGAMRPVFARVFAGLSGPAIRPLALRMVWEVAAAVEIPVIGIGGIASASDAIEFLLAGATAVAIGTGNFVSPTMCPDVVEGIRSYLKDRGIRSVRELTGRAARDEALTSARPEAREPEAREEEKP